MSQQQGSKCCPADQGMWRQIAGVFTGKTGWIGAVAMLYIFAFIALMVVAAVKFFDAAETRDMIMWATIFIAAIIGVSMLKMWFWMAITHMPRVIPPAC